jgi:hypothetical protein
MVDTPHRSSSNDRLAAIPESLTADLHAFRTTTRMPAFCKSFPTFSASTGLGIDWSSADANLSVAL